MAEKINLATLDINIDSLVKKAADTKQAIIALKEENKKLDLQTEAGRAQNVRNEAAIANLASTYRMCTKTIQAQFDEGGRLANQNDAIKNAVDRLNVSENDWRENNKQLLALRKELNTTTAEGQAQIAEINKKLDQNNAAIKENVSAYEKQKISIGQYKEQIIEAYREMDKEKKALQDLNKELEEQRDQTDKNSEEYKIFNQQINVNNTQINIYTDNMRAARGEQDEFSSSLEDTKGGLLGFLKASQQAGGAGPLLTSVFAAIRTGIIGTTKAGLAFIATPIGAFLAGLALTVGVVVGAFKFMTASMNSTEEGSQKLARVTATLTGFFNTFWKLLKPFGEFLGNAFVQYFDTVSAAISAMVDGLKAAAEFVGFDSAAESIEGYQKAFENSAKAAGDLAKAEGELQKMQRSSKLLQLDYQKQAEKLRQARDDESKSLAERELANINLGKVLKAQAADELAIARQRKEVADLFIKSEGETTEALDKRAEAVTEIADIEERITGQESEQLANRNSLRKESSDKSIAIEKDRQEKIKAALSEYANTLKLELDLFRQNNVDKAKFVDEQISSAQKVKEQQDKIAKAEYDASSKSNNDKLKLQVAYNDNAKELFDSQTAAILKNADVELEHILAVNKSKLDNNKFLTDELVSQEVDRLNRIAEAEKDNAIVRMEAEKKSRQEINDALIAIDNENEAKKQAINQQRKEAQQTADLIDLDNKRIAQGESFQYDLEAQLAEYDVKRQIEREESAKKGADMIAFDKATAEQRKNIEKSVQDNKFALASNTFAQLSNLLGKESAAGKALAIAQTTMDTYRGATAAYAALAGIVPAGPVLGTIAAGVAIATGLGNVQKIVSTKTPKAERGALFGIGGKRHSQGGTLFTGADGTRFEAEQGELIGVMNRNAAAHFMAFNNAFPAGGASFSPSSYLATGGIADRANGSFNVDYDILAAKIGAATAAANLSLPAPVVAVQDIATVSNQMVQVRDFASH
jgi:hypothetical protein